MAKVAVTPLQQIEPDQIKPNSENPRLFFREQEMVQLMESIREVGIKVPISVFEKGSRFVLIDGERRWRCAKRLNLSEVPAIVQAEPSRFDNLLMMFNIHNVREDWELIATATKLGDIRDMLVKEKRSHDDKFISALTGVPLTTVKRAFELLELPAKYQRMLRREAEKPKSEQRIKPDLFLEIYKSMHTVEKYVPEVFNQVSKREFVDAMVGKYVGEVISNVVAFRDLSKIARGERAGIDKKHTIPTVVRLVKQKNYGLSQAYEDTVQAAYEQRDLISRVNGLTDRISDIRRKLSPGVREALEQLRAAIDRLLSSQ